jgi:pimeloyl-ACP methyl ester carboxylesterase
MRITIKSNLRPANPLNSFVLASVILAALLSAAITARAQKFNDVQTQKSPLVLKAQGSFYVGGESVEQTEGELGSFGPAGHITVNQMYVRYMIPQNARPVPVVMIHGMTLTGKTWETTPDGRMGWDEYFVRKGHPVYVPDQVGRGRSGFNQAFFNNVRAGRTSFEKLPWIWRISDENTWTNFRFGTKPGVPYPGAQFPIAAIDEFSKQAVPDLSLSLPTPNPNYRALSGLAAEVKSAVLVSHSQSGAFPLEAALVNPSGIKGMVLVEPGVCPATYTEQQIATLATVPILIVYGDHLGDVPTGIPNFSWQTSFEGCRSFIARVNTAGGIAQMIYAPERGIRGSSHMIMQDRNNLQIADLILEWIGKSIEKRRG